MNELCAAIPVRATTSTGAPAPEWTSRPSRPGRVFRTVLATLAATAIATGATCALASHLLCNVTRSLPLGLYWMNRGGAVGLHDVVAFPVPAAVRDLVRDRHYLMGGALLLKPVAAVAGDAICVAGDTVSVNGRPVASLRSRDSEGRPLPRDARCGPLSPGSVYVLAHDPRSFDSRVFGPLDIHAIAATVTPLWTF